MQNFQGEVCALVKYLLGTEKEICIQKSKVHFIFFFSGLFSYVIWKPLTELSLNGMKLPGLITWDIRYFQVEQSSSWGEGELQAEGQVGASFGIGFCRVHLHFLILCMYFCSIEVRIGIWVKP